MKLSIRDIPTRLATGAYVAHTGYEKFAKGSEEQAKGVHGMATGAFPFLGGIEPTKFLRALGLGEMAVGGALLTPFVPNRLAGLALAGFSGSLLTMYWRTPALHRPNSPWPTQAGIGVSKDVWMFAIAVGLLISRKKQ